MTNNSMAIFVLIPSILAFVIGMLTTPLYTKFFYKYKLWRKSGREESLDKSVDWSKLSNSKELHTPRVGGMIVWGTVLIVSILFYAYFKIQPGVISSRLNFAFTGETFPLLVLFVFGAIIGLLDDLIQVYTPKRFEGDPIFLRYIKAGSVFLVSFLCGLYVYKLLDISVVHIPFTLVDINFGTLFPFVFAFIATCVFSSSVIDGMDGLAGGVLAIIYAAYAAISVATGLPELASFCAVVSASILVFLWFNIPPARFYLGETGMISLTLLLAAVAFLTDTVLLLPIIAFPLFITSVSVVLQIFTRKMFGQKFFKFAPLHHHFKALGWSRERVVMRYWVVALISAAIGTLLAIIS